MERKFRGSLSYYGNITKYDINGENPVMMHEFDSIHGYAPTGKLFLASNGKLYGTTNKGGIPAQKVEASYKLHVSIINMKTNIF